MIIGSRINAPEGFKSLEKDKQYYFLRSDAIFNRARFIEFFDGAKGLSAKLVTLTVVDFEEALEQDLIEIDDADEKNPPWLKPIHGISIAELESRRKSSKKSYDSKVNSRFMAISELVLRANEILASENPDAIINAHAKSSKPTQNAARVRLWFYTYLIFGHNKWALLPPLHRIGNWGRDVSDSSRKLGRPSRKGKLVGYRCDLTMQKKIQKGYLKYSSKEKTADTIYSDVVTGMFGCFSAREGEGFRFFHPKGEPFPSFAQYRYWVEKLIKPIDRSLRVWGKNKTRAQTGSQGSFDQRLINLNQLVEFDGYNISEKLSGLTEGSAVDGFCVVRALCCLSGAVVGMGFSEGKENMAAYEMCLFSMVLKKEKFCELFGLSIKHEQWPCEGLPGNIVFDRGPGATYDIEPQINWLGTFENTPTFSGQSKASVESSHPRDKKSLDQPTYFHSKLNVVEMARREILRTLADNATSDASGRMSDSMYLSNVKPTPLGIWNYWDGRGRNSAIGRPPEFAIRNFLSERPAVIKPDGVYLCGRKFRSKPLVSTGIFDKVARSGVIKINALVLTLCVRHIWIEVAGILYELDAVRSVRTLNGDIDISFRDLQEVDRIRRESVGELREERPAAQQYFKDQFKDEAGEDWHGGQRKLGRPSKGGAALRDTADYDVFRGKAK